ncbi:hypothetical protein M407DRAFT_224350, partial [Tulasnella calospora MUT 4182]
KPCPVSVGLANELPRESLTKKERIAIGYFADVYEGVLKGAGGIEMPVAIKVLREVGMGSSRTPQERNERLNKRLNRENAAWGRLRHPNILPVLGVCPGKTPWLITPWMKNGNLHDFVISNTELSFANKLELVISAAKGLLYLHSLDPPICHADIKPANALVSDDGTNALLSDFGLAASLTTLRSPHATSGNPEGTKRFQAPELFFESRRTLAGDVYSFGCLILAVCLAQLTVGLRKCRRSMVSISRLCRETLRFTNLESMKCRRHFIGSNSQILKTILLYLRTMPYGRY